jgi:NADPH-dependent 2,4-dienoyl-CoA reductase/sulfur reductase-like enzyme
MELDHSRALRGDDGGSTTSGCVPPCRKLIGSGAGRSGDIGGTMKVCVIGQGYVGLPLAMEAVRAGHEVAGLEVDLRRMRARRSTPGAT